jgi:uncharacterized RDD family membrane protein YckC
MPDWKPYRELLGSPTSPSSVATAPVAVVGQPAASAPGGLRVRQEETPPETERSLACSQCGAAVPASQIMRIGSAALCPNCQVGYRRQAQFGFGDRPAEYASPFVRLGAVVLDYIFCFAIALALVMGVPFLGRRFFADNPNVLGASGIGAVVCMFIWILDYFIGRIVRDGATPAMKLFRIKVVTATGDPVGGGRALGRFLMIGLTNSLTFCLGHLLVFFDKQSRSLHDLVCGTIVIKR